MTGPARRPEGRTAPRADRLVLSIDNEGNLLQIVPGRSVASGYRVLTGPDRVEALDHVHEVRPTWRLGGFEAPAAIRHAAPAARVIMLTAFPNRPLCEACRAHGADEFMLTPFHPGERRRLPAQALDRD